MRKRKQNKDINEKTFFTCKECGNFLTKTDYLYNGDVCARCLLSLQGVKVVEAKPGNQNLDDKIKAAIEKLKGDSNDTELERKEVFYEDSFYSVVLFLCGRTNETRVSISINNEIIYSKSKNVFTELGRKVFSFLLEQKIFFHQIN